MQKRNFLLRYFTAAGCMGPTRDGRIKPDIMAPGDSHIRPLRDALDPLIVKFDSVAIIGQDGSTKVGWGFQTGTMNWGTGDLHSIRNVRAENGTLVFDNHSYFSPYIWSDSTYKLTTPPKCELYDTLMVKYKVFQPQNDNGFNTLEAGLTWRVNDNEYHKNSVHFQMDISDTSDYSTFKICLGDLYEWKRYYSVPASNDTLVAVRFDEYGGEGYGGILGADIHDADRYVRGAGTSNATPQVSGIVALMLEKYKKLYLDPIGIPLEGNQFRNATSKALLIHTAQYMVKSTGYVGEIPNPDTQDTIYYHEGPDYSCGWGLVNAKKVMDYVDTSLFKEDSVAHQSTIKYSFVKNEWGPCRVTLTWDDYAILSVHSYSNAKDNKLLKIILYLRCKRSPIRYKR